MNICDGNNIAKISTVMQSIGKVVTWTMLNPKIPKEFCHVLPISSRSCGTLPMASRFAAISKSKGVILRSRREATAQATKANNRMGQMKALRKWPKSGNGLHLGLVDPSYCWFQYVSMARKFIPLEVLLCWPPSDTAKHSRSPRIPKGSKPQLSAAKRTVPFSTTCRISMVHRGSWSRTISKAPLAPLAPGPRAHGYAGYPTCRSMKFIEIPWATPGYSSNLFSFIQLPIHSRLTYLSAINLRRNHPYLRFPGPQEVKGSKQIKGASVMVSCIAFWFRLTRNEHPFNSGLPAGHTSQNNHSKKASALKTTISANHAILCIHMCAM